MKFKIFESNKEIDLERLVDTRALICSNSGGGKSYTARKILEETSGKVMSIIFDVDGELKTLREKYDFLLIGSPEEGADVGINLRAADILPKKIMELGTPTIIDLSSYPMRDRIQYVKKFLRALLNLPRSLWKTCIVFLDESHKFCGQQEKQDSTYEVIDLMSLGRKRGICGILATQRIAKLHKDAVAECNNVFVGRTWLDLDQKRAANILGFTNKKDIMELRNLEDGEFWVFGPAIGRDVEKEQVAKSKTVHPKRGMDLSDYISKPTDKIKSIMVKISDLPKEAEKELKEKKDFEKKIREQNIEIRKLQNGQTKPIVKEVKDLERAYARGVKETEIYYQSERKKDERYVMELEKMLKKIGDVLGAKQVFKKPMEIINTSKSIEKVSKKYPIRAQSVPNQVPIRDYSDEEIKLSPAYLRILKACASFYPNPITKARISFLANVPQKASTFRNGLSKLRTIGAIGNLGSKIICSDSGMEITGPVEEIPSDPDSLFKMWSERLSPAYQRILGIIYSSYPNAVSKEEISDYSNVPEDASTFRNGLSKLRSLGLIKNEGSELKMAEDFFE